MEAKNQKLDAETKNPKGQKSKEKIVMLENPVPEVDESALNKNVSKEVTDVQDDRPFDPVKNVTKKKEIWRLGVFLEDLLTIYKAEAEDHMELLLRDIKGDTIQAYILQNDIVAWKDKLCEGKTYYMRNFRVGENDSAFKLSPHKYRLTFVGGTKVTEFEMPGMPRTAFNFKDFQEIHSGKYRPDLCVDAIGVINSVGKCVSASSTKKGNVAFTLKDLRDNVMDCTLWDSLSVEFLNFYNQRTGAGPIVLVMKHVRVKEAQGIYPLQLTNIWNGTKLLFDDNLPEIKAFISSLPKGVTYMSQNSGVPISSNFYTQTSAGSQYNSEENFMKQARVICLGDMKKMKQDTFCVTVVTTSHIRVSNQGWFFYACHDCSCKAEGREPPFVCKNGHKTNDPLIKFKLDVEVYDGEDTAKFVFWDDSLEDLLGMTAKNLLEKERKKGLGDPQDYPDILEDIMDRKFAFRVKWTPGWGGQASVLSCKDSKDLVAKIQEQLPVAESPFQDIEDNIAVEEPVIAINESPPIQQFTQDDIDKFASLDDSIMSTPNVSASAENDLPTSAHKTPAKRSAGKQQPPDNVGCDGQFSSTRSGKRIKKEKM